MLELDSGLCRSVAPFANPLAVFAAVASAAGMAAMFLMPPMAQPAGYHDFADERMLLGIPNFWNVVSNIVFLAVGVIGLAALARGKTPGVLGPLRPAYVCFFFGTALLAFGSGYYHLAPSSERLVWDRLTMAISLMAFVAIVAGEQIAPALGARLLPAIVAAGVLAVFYWWLTNRDGLGGDLRPYVLVQLVPMTLAPLLLLVFRSPFTRVSLIWSALASYGVAKAFETFDKEIFDAIHVMGGHALKHVAAGVGTYMIYVAATKRSIRSRSL